MKALEGYVMNTDITITINNRLLLINTDQLNNLLLLKIKMKTLEY